MVSTYSTMSQGGNESSYGYIVNMVMMMEQFGQACVWQLQVRAYL